jgi:hypothetical protein
MIRLSLRKGQSSGARKRNGENPGVRGRHVEITGLNKKRKDQRQEEDNDET